MYAVIFRATLNELSDDYISTAIALRDLALEKYGCLEFHSTTEGDKETAISYWPSLESISAWRADPLHRQAQEQAKSTWYSAYDVEVAKIERSYSSEPV